MGWRVESSGVEEHARDEIGRQADHLRDGGREERGRDRNSSFRRRVGCEKSSRKDQERQTAAARDHAGRNQIAETICRFTAGPAGPIERCAAGRRADEVFDWRIMIRGRGPDCRRFES